MLKFSPASLVVITLATGGLLGCATAPAANPVAETPDINYEGLATVSTRHFNIAQIRPGVDFAAYSGVILEVPELAFRTPDRSDREFPLNQQQKDRFRDMLTTAFERELASLSTLKLVDERGPDVLSLNVRVQDIVVSVSEQSVSRAGRGAAVLQASAAATIILELMDAQSNEILARAVDARSAEGAALRQRDDTMTTRFEEAEKIVKTWAAIATSGLENLTSGR